MTAEEQAKFAAAERELNEEKGKRELDAAAEADAEVPVAKKKRTEVVV